MPDQSWVHKCNSAWQGARLYYVDFMRIFVIISKISILGAIATVLSAQHVELQDVSPASFPALADSNSQALWIGKDLVLFNSTGMGPIRSSGPTQFGLDESQPV